MKTQKETDLKSDARLVQVRPSRRQIRLQQMEFYAFVHFTVNTYTGKEWGDGTEDPAIFHPRRFDAARWVDAVKAAGMKGLILTCKHHDGFCLWPSAYTRHSIASSPYREGKGDIVREVADACREGGIRFGVYLSPWDRNSEFYGRGKEYDDYFVGQLTELLTNYGEIFAVWLDGACGEGSDGKKQYYDWERYYETVRRLQPEACIHVCGPDIRWCGNEAGDTRPSEWSVVPARTKDTETIASRSQQAEDTDFGFRGRKISAGDRDLGSREALRDEMSLVWYPAEVNTSIRPGWFYHAEEDVRSLEELISIYLRSVGGNATFLLNIPPTKDGLFSENDVRRLQELGAFLERSFRRNLALEAEFISDSHKPGFGIENVREPGYEKYFTTEDGTRQCAIELVFREVQTVRYAVLQENIECSQRVERFVIEAEQDGGFREVYRGTVIGYKRIAPLPDVRTRRLRLRILDARVAPTLSFVGVYPPQE
ncbi:MAG: alpha-L-fucosidase [Roseburia sp.]|nr:alpha-L-fucosidase [Roseburia sp.]MCM1096494.1 alpha-L-fucosidase [Ruminococcus flavefaciens]